MKTLIKILVLIVCVVIVWYLFFNTKKEKHDGSAEDANAIPSFSVAQQYARNNEYGKAYRELEKYYEYCIANDYAASLGVRGSFALSLLQEIIENDSESKQKLEKTCLEIESAIASGDISHYKFDEKYIRQRNPEGKGGIDEQTKNAMLFDNLVVFNQARKMDNVTISVFEKMESANPEVAKKCWNRVQDIVFKEKRYDIVSHYIKDLEKSCRHLMAQRSKALKDNPIMQQNKALSKAFMIQNIKDLLDYGLATNQKVTVKKLVKDLLKQGNVNPEDFQEYLE